MNSLFNLTTHLHLPNLMKATARVIMIIGAFCLIVLLAVRTVAQQATLTDDAQTSAAAANQNFGNNASVRVSGPNIRGFFKFKLTPNLTPGTTGSRVGKATLKLFVAGVNTPGTFDVFRVNGAWDEATVTGNTAPPIGNMEGAITVDDTLVTKWITLDVTQLVKDWLDGVLPNEGIVLIANGGVGNVIFNSKENQATSHEARLEVVLNHAATADRATEADHAINADQANSLAGVVPVVNGGTGLSSAGATGNFLRSDGSSWTSGPLTAADVPTGSASYIQNSTTQQEGTNFNISGDGALGGRLSANTINANTQYDIGGARVLSIAGTQNTIVGVRAGQALTTGEGNAFFGFNAGMNNAEANNNAFFGSSAGQANTNGSLNSFFGTGAGLSNSIGGNNSFFGANAGRDNATGAQNSFFGASAGEANTTGGDNSFFGWRAGQANTTGFGNSFFGTLAGVANTTGVGNSFFGDLTGFSNTTGHSNSFFGVNTGLRNTTGSGNSFFGISVGMHNTEGNQNSFFGSQAGFNNRTGSFNSFFGVLSGHSNVTGDSNTFFGNRAGTHNTDGNINAFFGTGTGESNTTGVGNAFFGSFAGRSNTTGSRNLFLGVETGDSNTTEDFNSFVGGKANGAAGITNSTAIGANAQVTQSNSLVLGSINGINEATADSNVGIGTTAPQTRLHVEGGNILVGSAGQGIILKSPNGATCRLLTIDDAGALALMPVTCP